MDTSKKDIQKNLLEDTQEYNIRKTPLMNTSKKDI